MNSKLHVLMLVPQFPYPVVGGLEHQALKLSRALIDRGIAVSALSGKVRAGQPGRETVDGVNVVRISDWRPLERYHFQRTAIALLTEFLKLRTDVDVVHVHQNSWYGLFGTLAAKLIGKPVLTKLPNVREYGIPGIAAQPAGRLRLALLKRSNGFVAMSEESIAELTEIHVQRSKILAVPNGIELGEHLGAAIDQRPQGIVKFSFIGRLEPEKNIPVLLRAWREALPSFKSQASLNIWGSGSLESEVRGLLSDHGLNDTVKLLGYCDDVPGALSASDALVQPSAAEGNSNTVLEAMRAGLPVIATSVGGTQMQVGPHGLRLLSEPGDVATLAEHLTLLANDQSLRLDIGKRMAERVRELFDIRRIAAVYEAAYRELLGSKSPDLSKLHSLPTCN
jgi:glycosyltransferase involved in cell wall biosynthesis